MCPLDVLVSPECSGQEAENPSLCTHIQPALHLYISLSISSYAAIIDHAFFIAKRDEYDLLVLGTLLQLYMCDMFMQL
jgi:hypothetical protein